MAELSTIARPYAQGLMKALKDRNAGAEDVAQDLEVIEALASLTKNPEVATLVGDPKLTDDQLCDLIAELCGNAHRLKTFGAVRCNSIPVKSAIC